MKLETGKTARLSAIVCIVGLVLLLSSGSLWAEMRKGAVTISPMVGGYLFEGNQDRSHGFLTGLGLGYNFTANWGTELSGKYIDFETDAGASGTVLSIQLDLLYHILPKSRISPYLAVGTGLLKSYISGVHDTDPFYNYGLGVNIFLTPWLALRGDVRHVIPFANNYDIHYNNLSYAVGLNFVLGGRSPAPKPPPPMDSDGDGVYDSQDSCPGTPQGVKVGVEGCPLDSDADGVYDYLDKCPDTPKGVKVDGQGCPLDSDGDGVFDYLDKCPDTPPGKRVDAEGCPLKEVAAVQPAMTPAVLDADGDGINDDVDKCLNTPPGVKVNAFGCWVIKVHFDFDKWNIKSGDYRELNDFVATLKRYTDLDILIEGHTDNIGSAAYNRILSQKRARAVLEYLVKHGIGRSRLSAIGYGAARPLVPNTSKANRAINRRVQLSQ